VVFAQSILGLPEGHGTAGAGTQAILTSGDCHHGVLLRGHGSEAGLAIKPPAAVSANRNHERHGPAMEQAVAELSSYLALCLTLDQGPASRFQRVAHDLSQGAIARLFVRRQDPTLLAQPVSDNPACAQRRVASDLAALAQICKQLGAAPVPWPFFD